MRTAHLFAAALAILLLLTTDASAQDQRDQQFNDHDRQVTRDWYNQHQNNPPRGMRSQDRFTAEQEQRLQIGQPFDRELERHSYRTPRDLSRRLPRVPKHHKYVVVGHHVVLIDGRNHVVRDVVHLHIDYRQR
jgi:hypothetical protein